MVIEIERLKIPALACNNFFGGNMDLDDQRLIDANKYLETTV